MGAKVEKSEIGPSEFFLKFLGPTVVASGGVSHVGVNQHAWEHGARLPFWQCGIIGTHRRYEISDLGGP